MRFLLPGICPLFVGCGAAPVGGTSRAQDLPEGEFVPPPVTARVVLLIQDSCPFDAALGLQIRIDQLQNFRAGGGSKAEAESTLDTCFFSFREPGLGPCPAGEGAFCRQFERQCIICGTAVIEYVWGL